jgi:protein-S-isoprenylcysteine O-methyltransferase Ste14
MKGISFKENIFIIVMSLLCIACFPLNPLVLTGVLEPAHNPALNILGWIAWAVGMVLILTPIVMFPRRGGVAKGESFVHTTKLVDTGIYSVIRHPQYIGGILAIFIATPLLYPHWLFVVMGIPGAVISYWSTYLEDTRLIGKFGDDYKAYIERVPRANFIRGIYRRMSTGKKEASTE